MMKGILIWSSIAIMTFALTSCGQDGAAIAPGSSGSTIEQVKADCNGQSCI